VETKTDVALVGSMVDISPFATNLILPILLLLPGLLGLKVFLYRADRVDAYSRLDAIIYSIGISIVSFLLLYGAYGLYLWSFPTFQDVQFSSLPLLIGLYLGHVGVSSALGYVAGRVSNRRDSGGRDTTRKEIWDYAFDEIYSDSRVRVFTNAGSEIEGTVVRAGQPLQSRDLILASPYELKDEDSQDKKRAVSLGDYTYIHEQAVSHIGFFEDLNEDLDLETLRQLGYAPVEPGKVEEPDEDVDEELEKELQQELEEDSEAEEVE
jgi:hypothetical protein